MLRPLRSSNSGIVWARGRTEIKAVLVLLTPCRLSKTHSDWTSLLRTTRHFGSTAEVSVRHIGSAAEVSGHFGSIPLLPKCPTAEVSCCRSVRTPNLGTRHKAENFDFLPFDFLSYIIFPLISALLKLTTD